MNHPLNEHQLEVLRLRTLCFACGRRLGQHRYGDNTCPNTQWKPGNGQPQWREGWRFRMAR